MEKFCADCAYLGRKESDKYTDWWGKTKYKCHKTGEYKKLDDNACSNIKEYKELIDSIRYICNFNGFDPDFEYDEDIKNPSIPENGKLENNHFVGYRLKENKEGYIFPELISSAALVGFSDS